ncbi:hypothetical protein FHR92_001760 [Fontibacillus solani]|uniref:Uncharacterized protein n=1 Tax=Fontibacillus solani TaxID=1572857 RepID=A0A7W3XR87_9BACL|nr:hypothetical protein [Fontibacillus solani]
MSAKFNATLVALMQALNLIYSNYSIIPALLQPFLLQRAGKGLSFLYNADGHISRIYTKIKVIFSK